MSQTRILEPGDQYQSKKKTSEVSVAQTGKYLKPQKGISNQYVRECFLLGLECFALDPIAFCIECVCLPDTTTESYNLSSVGHLLLGQGLETFKAFL